MAPFTNRAALDVNDEKLRKRDALTNSLRAGNGTRTRDPNLGKVVLYQLSYSRRTQGTGRVHAMTGRQRLPAQLDEASYCRGFGKFRSDGGEGNRTPDLLNAIQALSQLSYAPGLFSTTARLRRERRARWSGTAKYSHGYCDCQRK